MRRRLAGFLSHSQRNCVFTTIKSVQYMTVAYVYWWTTMIGSARVCACVVRLLGHSAACCQIVGAVLCAGIADCNALCMFVYVCILWSPSNAWRQWAGALAVPCTRRWQCHCNALRTDSSTYISLTCFLANVNSSSCSLYVIGRPSVVCLSVVCL